MKKIILVLISVILSLFVTSADAKEKTIIRVSKTRVSIQVGNIEYVSTTKEGVETYNFVRVWNSPDMLLYDLDKNGVDYKSTARTLMPKKMMSQVEAQKKWAEYIKKFEKLRKEVEVFVDAE